MIQFFRSIKKSIHTVLICALALSIGSPVHAMARQRLQGAGESISRGASRAGSAMVGGARYSAAWINRQIEKVQFPAWGLRRVAGLFRRFASPDKKELQVMKKWMNRQTLSEQESAIWSAYKRRVYSSRGAIAAIATVVIAILAAAAGIAVHAYKKKQDDDDSSSGSDDDFASGGEVPYNKPDTPDETDDSESSGSEDFDSGDDGSPVDVPLSAELKKVEAFYEGLTQNEKAELAKIAAYFHSGDLIGDMIPIQQALVREGFSSKASRVLEGKLGQLQRNLDKENLKKMLLKNKSFVFIYRDLSPQYRAAKAEEVADEMVREAESQDEGDERDAPAGAGAGAGLLTGRQDAQEQADRAQAAADAEAAVAAAIAAAGKRDQAALEAKKAAEDQAAAAAEAARLARGPITVSPLFAAAASDAESSEQQAADFFAQAYLSASQLDAAQSAQDQKARREFIERTVNDQIQARLDQLIGELGQLEAQRTRATRRQIQMKEQEIRQFQRLSEVALQLLRAGTPISAQTILQDAVLGVRREAQAAQLERERSETAHRLLAPRGGSQAARDAIEFGAARRVERRAQDAQLAEWADLKRAIEEYMQQVKINIRQNTITQFAKMRELNDLLADPAFRDMPQKGTILEQLSVFAPLERGRVGALQALQNEVLAAGERFNPESFQQAVVDNFKGAPEIFGFDIRELYSFLGLSDAKGIAKRPEEMNDIIDKKLKELRATKQYSDSDIDGLLGRQLRYLSGNQAESGSFTPKDVYDAFIGSPEALGRLNSDVKAIDEDVKVNQATEIGELKAALERGQKALTSG